MLYRGISAPADLPKQAASFDLPIALGLLAASGQIAAELLERYAIVGELALDGSMRPVRGALSMAMAAKAAGHVRGLLAPSSTAITGWTVFSDQIAWTDNANTFSLSAQDGSKFLDLQDPAATGSPFGGVTQTISTTIGQAYRLTFYIGALESNAPDPNLGGPVTVRASAGATSMNFIFTPPANSGMQWMPFDLDFTAASSTTAISLLSIAGENFHGLDNVSVDAIPEAGAWMLLGIVAAGTGVVRRFRRT